MPQHVYAASAVYETDRVASEQQVWPAPMRALPQQVRAGSAGYTVLPQQTLVLLENGVEPQQLSPAPITPLQHTDPEGTTV